MTVATIEPHSVSRRPNNFVATLYQVAASLQTTPLKAIAKTHAAAHAQKNVKTKDEIRDALEHTYRLKGFQEIALQKYSNDVEKLRRVEFVIREEAAREIYRLATKIHQGTDNTNEGKELQLLLDGVDPSKVMPSTVFAILVVTLSNDTKLNTTRDRFIRNLEELEIFEKDELEWLKGHGSKATPR